MQAIFRTALGLLSGILFFATAYAADTIKIGGIVPLSPPGSVPSGESMRDGMKVAVNEINAAGGLLGKQVELVIEISSGVPEKAIPAFERLVTKEKVVAVTGEAHSAACNAVRAAGAQIQFSLCGRRVLGR